MRSMKIKLLLLLLILAVFLPLALHAQCQVETEYNRFTNVSTVGTPLDYLTTPIGVLFQSFTHDTHKEADSIKMVLARGGSSFRYTDCHSVIILKDGVRIDLPFDYKPSMHSSGESVSEIWTATLTLDMLYGLSRAKRVEYRICGDEYTVDETVLCSGRLICEMRSKKAD